MDRMESNVDELLCEKDGKVNSDEEIERDVRTTVKGYDVGLDDRKGSISPPKLKLASQFRPRLSPPLYAMDIPSVRYRPAPVLTQAELTFTYGYSRLEMPSEGRNNSDNSLKSLFYKPASTLN